MVKLATIAAFALAAAPAAVHAVDNLKTDWEAYTSKLKIPDVIDATKGGSFDFQIARATHNWTSDGKVQGDVYGYGLKNGTATFPGPTIKVKKGVPISVTWWNLLETPHLLDEAVELDLDLQESRCFPYCGIPVVVHVHGLESPAKYDGLPRQTVYMNQSREMVYLNNQSAATKLYHDHASGFTRLNVWSGLAGIYIIEDKEADKKFNVDIETDIPLVIGDRLITNKGELKYSDDNCKPAGTTTWIPESFGTVNTVNGVVMPYVEVPNAQVRFRVVNIANSRNYNFSIPFASKCSVIAKDSGYVEKVLPLDEYVNMFSFERIEVVCDFSNEADGTKFEITDIPTIEQDTPYDPRILEIRVKSSLKTATMVKKEIPNQLVKYKSLKTLFEETGGKNRAIMLGEIEYAVACPIRGLIRYRNVQTNMSTPYASLACTKGKVEKWHFKNPTDDPHPFHWHLVNAQCGETDDTIDTNAMKDVVVIPNAGDRVPTTITQVCYVACTPDEFLIEGATRGPTEYNFDTSEPYVAHCHILEHEENAMMAFFKLTDKDDDAADDSGYVAPTGVITSEVVWTAMGMSVLGGISMCFSIFVISVPRLQFLASHRALSIAFALAAGVMSFISLADLIPEAIVFFKAHFTVGGAVDPEAYEYGGDTSGGGVCDKTCNGHAWLAMTGTFFAGMVIILIVEYIVHQWFERRMGATRHSHGELPPELGKVQTAEDTEKGLQNVQSPVPNSPAAGGNVELESPHAADSALLNNATEYKDEYKRAGIMTGIAMAIHNFPEGLALFVSSLRGLKTGLVLSIGIILHNIPEGVAVAAPVYYATGSKVEAFKWTLVSGVAQPLGAAIGWAAVSGGLSYGLQGALYGLVAGMLMCICAKELFPGAYRFDPSGKYFVSAFFTGMGLIAFGLILLHYAGSG
jgi:zinc transporter, ZIP family